MTPSGISQIPLQKYVQAFDIDKLTLTRSTLQINHLVKIIQTFKYFPKLKLQKGLSKMPQKSIPRESNISNLQIYRFILPRQKPLTEVAFITVLPRPVLISQRRTLRH